MASPKLRDNCQGFVKWSEIAISDRTSPADPVLRTFAFI